MKTSLLLAAGALAQLALSTPLEHYHQLLPRDDDSCGPNLQTCNPSAANSETLPALGPDFSSLYLSLLDSVKGINFKRSTNDPPRRRDDDDIPSFCCAASTSCLTLALSSSTIPFCYDKFTTNYIFPDGSSGTLATGLFTTPDGASTANLLTGDFHNSSSSSAAVSAASGVAAATGNIYAADPDTKPNTATLSIPPQYTAEGVGSAIPLTELGTVVASATATATAGGTTATATASASEAVGTAASSSASAASASHTGGAVAAAAMGAGWVPGAVVVGAGWAWVWVVTL